jgi:hypothetical protein
VFEHFQPDLMNSMPKHGEHPMIENIAYLFLKPHPLAKLFPAYSDEDLIGLADDIADNNLHNPIVLYEGQILDGVNRYKFCRAAATNQNESKRRPFTDSMFTEYQGSDPVGFVISMNLKRRHLDTKQRALIAAELATMKSGTRTDKNLGSNGPRSVADAAKLMNVSERSVKRATALRKTNPTLAEEIKQGKKPKEAAAKKEPLAPKQGKKAREAELRKLSDERFEKSAVILEDFAKTYFDMPVWQDIVTKIKYQLHALGRDTARSAAVWFEGSRRGPCQAIRL